MKYIVHKAEERGSMDIGWLKAKYSFSFARYYDPNKQGFGYLRVLNDDIIAAGGGFDTHPHDNMEIITIPFRGALAHKDSSGGEGVITSGEVQIMSAGTGVYHSEKNASSTNDVNLFQLWIHPKEVDIKPRYDQRKFDLEKNINNLTKIVSPTDKDTLWINQDAELFLGEFNTDTNITYKTLDGKYSYVYIIMIEGSLEILNEGENLNPKSISNGSTIAITRRDAVGLIQVNEINLKFGANSKVLIIDMNLEDELKEG